MPTANLTDAFVKSAKCEPDRSLSEYRDAAVRGLELRVTAGGTKSWRLHYTRRSDGRRRAINLGSYPALPLKEARIRAKRLQAEIEDAESRADPAAGVRARKAAMTFNELANDWLERHARPNKTQRAVRDDVSMLDRHIRPRIGGIKAMEIAKRDVIRLLDEVAAQPDARKGSVSSRRMTHRPNRVFELVRAIFRWGVARDLITSDPTQSLPPPIKNEAPRERTLSPEEIRILWSALDQAPISRRITSGRPRGEAVVGEGQLPMTRATALTLKLSLVTGQRIGEVACIAIDELDLSSLAPVWTIPGARTKNGRTSRVPLSPIACRLIAGARAIVPESRWLFPNPAGTGPIDPHAPTRALARARAVIGLADFRIHDLRRTAATQLAEIGFAPHTIELVLNHISARKGTITGKVYVQYSYDKEKREALEAWGSKLERIVG